MSFAAVTNSIKKAEVNQDTQFRELLITAADIYISTKRNTDFASFGKTINKTCVAAQTLIDKGYLNPKLEPRAGVVSDYQVRATIQADLSIEYKVILKNETC